jgi:sugar/nucleoside kinase (ribokinase family)
MEQRVRAFDTVTVFGGATVDRIARSSAPPVMGASNPGVVRRVPGGVGFNVASILARLGFHTRLVSRVGNDGDGEQVVAAAEAAGIGVAWIAVSPDNATAGYHATFDDGGELMIGIAAMAICDEISPEVVAPIATVAGVNDIWVADANLPADTLAFLSLEAANAGRPFVGLTVSPAKAIRFAPLLDRITYLFTNRREGAALLGHRPDDPLLTTTRIASHLAATNPVKAVVTNGVAPLAVANGAELRSFTPLRTDIVRGVNGAGDSFAAGTIAGLAEGRALHDAIRQGLAAAALTVEAGSIAAATFTPGALADRIATGAKRIAS